jgi:hypothetical protein
MAMSALPDGNSLSAQQFFQAGAKIAAVPERNMKHFTEREVEEILHLLASICASYAGHPAKLLRLDGFRCRGLGLVRLFGDSFHAVAEGTDSFAEAMTQFRQLLGSKHEQRDHQDHNDVARLK